MTWSTIWRWHRLLPLWGPLAEIVCRHLGLALPRQYPTIRSSVGKQSTFRWIKASAVQMVLWTLGRPFPLLGPAQRDARPPWNWNRHRLFLWLCVTRLEIIREIKQSTVKSCMNVQVRRLIHEFFNREILNHAMTLMTFVSIHRLFIKNVDVYRWDCYCSKNEVVEWLKHDSILNSDNYKRAYSC